MSYIENLTGNTIEGGLQETLALGAGNFKIRGFNLTNTGDYLVLSSGIALIDGLRVKSTGNLKLPIVDTFNKYILLRIRTYTEVVDGLTVRKAELSLVIQSTPTIVNNADLYASIVGTKDVLLGIVNGSGVPSTNIENVLLVYDTGWKSISMVSGYTYIGDGVRRIGNVVYLSVWAFNKTDSTAIPSNTTIGTLPIEFAPSTARHHTVLNVVGQTNCYFQIKVDGAIFVGSVVGAGGFYCPSISYII